MYLRFDGENPFMSGKAAWRSADACAITPVPHSSRRKLKSLPIFQ
jgi:hypothetical protein